MAAVSKLVLKLFNREILKSASATPYSFHAFSSESNPKSTCAHTSGQAAYTDVITEDENKWEMKLSPKQYAVCKLKSTERPYTSTYVQLKDRGIYACICCGNHLFQSDYKFDSVAGYPSFSAAIDHCGDHRPCPVKFEDDWSSGTLQKEVLCAKCGAHLGHVYRDGPKPSGLRYSINGTALKFIPCAPNRGCMTEVNYWEIGPQPETSAIESVKHD